MIYMLQEKIFSINEFGKMSKQELKELRNEISDRIHWLLTTENYDSKKVAKLTSNENKINKIIIKEL